MPRVCGGNYFRPRGLFALHWHCCTALHCTTGASCCRLGCSWPLSRCDGCHIGGCCCSGPSSNNNSSSKGSRRRRASLSGLKSKTPSAEPAHRCPPKRSSGGACRGDMPATRDNCCSTPCTIVGGGGGFQTMWFAPTRAVRCSCRLVCVISSTDYRPEVYAARPQGV